jgi:hypothetical protein
MLRRCIRGKIKNSARRHSSRSVPESRIFLLLRIWQDAELTFKTSAWSLISRWQARSKLTCIVLVRLYHIIGNVIIYGDLGRTGRAGKQGTAITFLTNDDDEVMCVCDDISAIYLTNILVSRYDLKQGKKKIPDVLACSDVRIVYLQRFRRVRYRKYRLNWQSMKRRNTKCLGR